MSSVAVLVKLLSTYQETVPGGISIDEQAQDFLADAEVD